MEEGARGQPATCFPITLIRVRAFSSTGLWCRITSLLLKSRERTGSQCSVLLLFGDYVAAVIVVVVIVSAWGLLAGLAHSAK